MGRLVTDLNLPDPDRAYRMLTDAHRGLDDEASNALNTRLLLLLANHLGDLEVLEEAIAAARGDVAGASARAGPRTGPGGADVPAAGSR